MICERVNVKDLRFDNNVIVAFSFWFESAVKHYTRALVNEPENTKHLPNRVACYWKPEHLQLCIEV